ncbi:WG repeat-containing protein [Fusibacter sp. JL216-2]|uniref:WG repeat-containing protein n=1 Tax=Fusibacter sp. JL216-2 TaxID=3071453 RepID=UPI003D34EFD1
MKFKLTILSIMILVISSFITYADEESSNIYKFVDSKGKVILSFEEYDDVRSFSSSLARVKLNGLYGYINTNGDVVIEPKYKRATDFIEGYAYVKMLNDTNVIIDKIGEIVNDLIDENYDKEQSVETFFSNSKQKYGLCNNTGIVLSAKYDGIYQVHPALYLLENQKKYGFYNSITDKLMDPMYPTLSFENEEECISYSDNESVQGLMDLNGDTLIETNKTVITYISPKLREIVKDQYFNFGAVSTNGPPDIHTKVGRIRIDRSENGLMLIKVEYYMDDQTEVKYALYGPRLKTKVCEISEEYVDVGYNFLVSNSKELETTKYHDLYGNVIQTFSDNFTGRSGAHIVLQKSSGEFYLADIYKTYLEQENYLEVILPVEENSIVVKSLTGYGIVGLDGEIITDMNYEIMSSINNGVVVATKNSEQMYLSIEGNVIYKAKVGEYLNEFSEGYGLIENVK